MVAHTLFLLTTLKTFTLELTLYFDGYKQTPLPHMCIFFYFSTVHHLFTLPSHSTLPSSHKYVLLSISSLLTSPPPECTGKNLSIYPPLLPRLLFTVHFQKSLSCRFACSPIPAVVLCFYTMAPARFKCTIQRLSFILTQFSVNRERCQLVVWYQYWLINWTDVF